MIGIFDSGIGGLTVARAIYDRLPGESTIYFGDTARVPYGPKSPETVRRYSREILHWLLQQGVKMVVIACNTSTAHVLGTLQAESPVPVIGVIEPGARAAVAATKGGPVGVIGTAGTIASNAYARAIQARLADAVLLTYTLPLFVPLVEWLWLGERLSPRLAGPLAVGFVGIVVILRPTPGLFRPVALLALLSAVLAAIGQVGIRRLTATEPAPRIVFYFAAIATAISAVPAALAWVTPPAQLWPVVAAMGLLATGGQLLLTRAYSSAPAAWVGPFLYTSVVFSGAFDWLFWRVLPDGLFLAGSVLVVVAAVLTLKLRGKGEPEPA